MNCQELTNAISNIKAHITEFDKFINDREPDKAIIIKDNINKIIYPHFLTQLDKGEKEIELRIRLAIRKGYLYVDEFHSERAIARQKNIKRFYIIDVTGKRIGNFAKDGFEWTRSFSDNRAKVYKNDKWYFIDPDGNKMGNFAKDGFENAFNFSNNRARVVKDNKVFFIDPNGNRIGNFAQDGFEIAYDFVDNQASVYKNDKSYVIDPDGKLVEQVS